MYEADTPRGRGIGGYGVAVAWLFLLAACGLAWWWWPAGPGPEPMPPSQDLSFERLTNASFTPEPADPLAAPEVKSVRIPDAPGDRAVWGATGRDDQGHVWFAVSVHGVPRPSARLFEYDAAADAVFERGEVLSELARAGLLRDGDQQPKIHSKIVQGGDGHLYFTSMDETTDEGGPRPPPFGSHLWRLRMPERTWEHLLAVPEGLIACAGGGDIIYALGYADHKLYQYDCRTGGVRSVTVGTYDGHISRNFLTDTRGHVYVPRLRRSKGGTGEHTLVEFDVGLREVGSSPMVYYAGNSPVEAAHGIIAFQHLPDRSIAFTTHAGRLYRVVTDVSGPALLTDLGWFHPNGPAYTPALLTYSGMDALVGLGRRPQETRFDWLSFSLKAKMTVRSRFPLPESLGPARDLVLYGSQTRDQLGNFYLVGAYREDGRSRPIVLRAGPPAPKGTPPSGPDK
jgi:hypothetical protein